MPDRTLSLEEARALVAAALRRCRTSPGNAASVARALVAAEADGLKGHGLVRVPSYAAQAKSGKVDGCATPVANRAAPGALAVDAANGFAYPALELAIAALPEIAREQGVAVAAIRRSHHCGAAGHPVEALARKGLVAMLFANTPAAIAPWGGARGLYGTNPIAFACPLPDASPIVVDLSLSNVPRGHILAARQKGEKIPEGWAFDSEGRPITDPDEALKGTMTPVGGAKGAALALMVELLAAGMTGANYATEASSFFDDSGPPPGTGQLILAFDPISIGGPATISRFGALAEMIESEANARLPGSRRLANRAAADKNGLAVDANLIAEIESL
jgi:(2R)-3-sulfolactate dehydrogenase (NADP+)